MLKLVLNGRRASGSIPAECKKFLATSLPPLPLQLAVSRGYERLWTRSRFWRKWGIQYTVQSIWNWNKQAQYEGDLTFFIFYAVAYWSYTYINTQANECWDVGAANLIGVRGAFHIFVLYMYVIYIWYLHTNIYLHEFIIPRVCFIHAKEQCNVGAVYHD